MHASSKSSPRCSLRSPALWATYLACALGAAACASDARPRADLITASDRVVVAKLEPASLTDDTIELRDVERELHPDDVIVHSGKTPYLRRVVSVEPHGRGAIVRTAHASLEDVFVQGHLGANDVVGVAAPDDARIRPADFNGPRFSGFSFKFDDTTIVADGTTTVQMTVGRFDFDGGLDFDAQFDGGRLDHLRLAVRGGFSTKMGFKVIESGSFSVSQKLVKLAEPPPQTFYVQAGPIPVVIAVKLELYLAVGGSVSGSVSAHEVAAASSSIAMGVECNGGSCGPIGDASFDFDADPVEIGGEGTARLTVPVVGKISFLFYDVAGPYVTLQPYAGVEIDRTATSVEASGILGVRSTAGGEIEILSRRVAGFQGTLFDWSTRFGGTSTPIGPAVCTTQLGASAGVQRCNRGGFVDAYESVNDCVKHGGGKACLTSASNGPVCGDGSGGGYNCDVDAIFACLCYEGGLACLDAHCVACDPNAAVCPTPP